MCLLCFLYILTTWNEQHAAISLVTLRPRQPWLDTAATAYPGALTPGRSHEPTSAPKTASAIALSSSSKRSAGAPNPSAFAPVHRDDEARLGFRYGPLPRDAQHRPKFGGEGAVVGLSVSVSDGGSPLVLEVRLADVTLLSRVLGTALARAEGGAPVRLIAACSR